MKLGRSDSRVADLLRNLSAELWAIVELIHSRASALGNTATQLPEVDKEVPQSPLVYDEGSLEALLNRFCRYERNTSERLALARALDDNQTVMLLDRIRSVANTSIRFLDIYACAMWLRREESDLPMWKPFLPKEVPAEGETVPTALYPRAETGIGSV
jgi:hypothetical protein